MKLLTQQDTRDTKAQEENLVLLRTQELNVAADKARKNLANAEADFKTTLAKNLEIWAKEEETHSNRVKEMSGEISQLEAKRAEALVPVTKLQQEAEELIAQYTLKNKETETKNTELEELREKLENKLDEIGQEKQDFLKARQKLELQQQGLDQQVENTKIGIKKLSAEIANFAAIREQAEKQVKERQTTVSLLESSILSKDSQLKTKEAQLSQWAVNIQTASFELDQKRKEALIPVETLKAEAAKLRDEAQVILTEAQRKQSEATLLKQQAEKDYWAKVKELDTREEKVTNEESRINLVWSQTRVDERLTQDRRKQLDADSVALDLKNKQFAKDYDTFITEKAMATKTVSDQLNEAKYKENSALKILAEAEEIKNRAHDQQVKLDKQKADQAIKQKDLEREEKRLTNWNQKNLELENQLKAGIVKLEKDSEQFAIWRKDAEDFVSDKQFDNSQKQKVLTKKEIELKRQEKFLAGWAIKLKDERGTLDRAWTELRTKSNIPLEKPQ